MVRKAFAWEVLGEVKCWVMVAFVGGSDQRDGLEANSVDRGYC
jgi:hypothetical protein